MKKNLNLPRVPLPKQLGGAHKDRTKVLFRKAKHKAQWRAAER
jgi:hypothetical protein